MGNIYNMGQPEEGGKATRTRGAMETPHHGNASKTAFEEFPFYFGKSLKTGKG